MEVVLTPRIQTILYLKEHDMDVRRHLAHVWYDVFTDEHFLDLMARTFEQRAWADEDGGGADDLEPLEAMGVE